MAEDVDNIVIEHLQAIRGQLGRVEDRVTDLGQRMTGLERAVASVTDNLLKKARLGAAQTRKGSKDPLIPFLK